MDPTHPITETPNSLSLDIDLASPSAIVRILRQTDAQIFAGYLGYPGLYDTETVESLVSLAERAAQTIAAPHGCIVLSGAGTSGRLAMLAARAFNHFLGRVAPPLFRYLIAGGDAAIVQAQEGAEDNPAQGITDLKAAIEGADDVFYVGITCGLSAPYIAGQLEEMLGREDSHSVLLGFNPLKQARGTSVEGWPFTFRDTAQRAREAPSATVLTPIVGPEAITGSTRMKGGTATKILLEILFHAAVERARQEMSYSQLRAMVLDMLRAYESACRGLYLAADDLARLISLGGTTLRSGGRINYLGPAAVTEAGCFAGDGNAGILALIDASECAPTYGADPEEVRGFVSGGWPAILPPGAADPSGRGGVFCITIDDFRSSRLDGLCPHDLCVFLGDFEGRDALIAAVQEHGAHTASMSHSALPQQMEAAVRVDAPAHAVLGSGPLELQIKLALNALSTGSYILAGKVFGNRMVDLRISNNKLFHRTVAMIGDLMKVPSEEAIEALLRSAFEVDALSESRREASISEVISAAKKVEKVVPKALLLATGRFTCAEATLALKRNPIVRAVIEKHVTG